MRDHQWVKIVITPVHVVDDPEVSSQPVIFVGEADETEAAECAQYGCVACDEVLTSETVKTLCAADDLGWGEVQQILDHEGEES